MMINGFKAGAGASLAAMSIATLIGVIYLVGSKMIEENEEN